MFNNLTSFKEMPEENQEYESLRSRVALLEKMNKAKGLEIQQLKG